MPVKLAVEEAVLVALDGRVAGGRTSATREELARALQDVLDLRPEAVRVAGAAGQGVVDVELVGVPQVTLGIGGGPDLGVQLTWLDLEVLPAGLEDGLIQRTQGALRLLALGVEDEAVGSSGDTKSEQADVGVNSCPSESSPLRVYFPEFRQSWRSGLLSG